jgi:hypothetical protein
LDVYVTTCNLLCTCVNTTLDATLTPTLHRDPAFDVNILRTIEDV